MDINTMRNSTKRQKGLAIVDPNIFKTARLECLFCLSVH